MRLPLLCGFLLAACSSTSAPSPDSSRPDLARLDLAQQGAREGGADHARDLGRDGPKAPAVWKPVGGTSPLTSRTGTRPRSSATVVCS